MIKLLFCSLIFLSVPLFAERITLDPSTRHYELHPKPKERIDTFDFNGEYTDLENIDINARRKKNVEFLLTGSYPSLETLHYEGSFGSLTSKLTGNFPLLSKIQFLCASCAMDFDLRTRWEKSCEITIQGGDEDIVLTLPEDIGIVVHTKIALKGKVIPSHSLKKVKKWGMLNKSYENELAATSPIVLTINIQAHDGRIILK